MKVRFDRIARVQAAMREQGLIALVVMNHDDYRYFFGTDRSQPRALIPFQGPPELIAFTGEEPELKAALAKGEVRVFGSVGGQIHDVVGRLRELASADPFGAVAAGGPGSGCRCGSTPPPSSWICSVRSTRKSSWFRRIRSWTRFG